MATRGRKPQDPRSPEEIAAQPKTKGLKQPGIVGARKKVAAVKKEKKAKGAAIEAAVAPKRKKSTPSTPFVGPKTEEKTLSTVSSGSLDPEEMKKKFKQTPVPDVDDPSTRGKVKRKLEKSRLEQIGNADALTGAERSAMATPVAPVEIKKEPALPADALRPKVTPLTDEVRSPFATGGQFTFQGPRTASDLEVPTAQSQSTDISPKVGKDLVRRMSKGRGLPGTADVRSRSLEIAQSLHQKQVARGEAHPLDVPTDLTPEVTTGHPMRQAIVEKMHNASEDQIRAFAGAKGMRFEDAVHGLHNLAMQTLAKDSPVQARVRKSTTTGKNELYDANVEAPPAKGFDVDFNKFLTADIHRTGGPKAAIEGRQRPALKAQNIVEEISGPKRSGNWSGKAKGGIVPFGPANMDPMTGEPERSGVGVRTPEVVKDLPIKPGKKPKASGGPKDTMGGDVPPPTTYKRAAAGVYRLTEPTAGEKTYLEGAKKEPKKKFVAVEQKKQRKSSARLAMAVRSGDDAAIQSAAFKHRGAQFTQLDMFPEKSKRDYQLRPEMMEVTRLQDGAGQRVVPAMPKPESYAEAIKTIPYSSGLTTDKQWDRPQFATSVTSPETVMVPRRRKPKSSADRVSLSPVNEVVPNEASPKGKGFKLSQPLATGVAGPSKGPKAEQPFLRPSVSEKKLREKFPDDYSKVDKATGEPKKQRTWNMMSRQFLGGNEVKVSPETMGLQQEASKARGTKDKPFANTNSASADLEANAAESKASYPKPKYPKVSKD